MIGSRAIQHIREACFRPLSMIRSSRLYLPFLQKTLSCSSRLALGLLPLVANAQAPKGPYFGPNSASLINPFTFPIEVLVVHPSGVGYDRYSVLLAEARSTVPLNMAAGSVIATFTPLEGLPYRHAPACAIPASNFTKLTSSLVHEEIAITDQGGVHSQGTHQQETIADEQGALELQQHLDELNTRIHDPVVAELRSEQYRDADPTTRAQMDQQAKQDQINTAVEALADIAAANSDFLFEHDYAAATESKQLSVAIQSKEQVLVDLQRKYDESQSRLKADRDFQTQAAAELRRRGGDALVKPTIAQVGRAYGGNANDQDMFALQMQAPADKNILFARASFDRGGDEDIFFRRIQGTSQWVATVSWPLESQKATIHLVNGNGWSNVGSVSTGRASIQQQMAGAKKAVGQLKSLKRSTDYSSQGGDETKTTIIP